VVFVAGHGKDDGIDYLFLPTDAAQQDTSVAGRKGFDGSTVLPWSDLERAVFGTKGERFLFVDTCHSAGAYNGKLGNEAWHNDVTAFTATGRDELAVELNKLQQGVFTYTIAQGLGPEAKTAAGEGRKEVRVSDLARFIAAKTASLIDTYWPNYEEKTKLPKPVPRLYQARDAEDHVLATIQ
jgi:uncharacterized caspase-like protein